MKLTLIALPSELAIVRRSPRDPIPPWAIRGQLFCVMRTADELSIVCEAVNVPDGERVSEGWRALRVEGTLAFEMVGVLSSLATVLAEAGISIFALSTWDTDYILVRDGSVEAALAALGAAGHAVRNLQP